MYRPIDLTDDDLWALFQSAASGDLASVQAAIARRPDLIRAEYDYTPALHFAVREGHLDITRLFLNNGANPAHRSHPFQDTLLTIAQDRGHTGIAQFLLALRHPPSDTPLHQAATAGDIPTIHA